MAVLGAEKAATAAVKAFALGRLRDDELAAVARWMLMDGGNVKSSSRANGGPAPAARDRAELARERVGWPLKGLAHGFFFVTFVLGPLAIDPTFVFSRTRVTYFAPLLMPKLLVLCVSVALGLLVWLLASPQLRLRSLTANVARARPLFLVAWATVVAVLVSVLFAKMPAALALTGSNVRFDGALVTALWLCLAPLAYVVVVRTRLTTAPVLYIAGIYAVLSGWLLAEAYGFEPVSLVNPSFRGVPQGVIATLGNSSLAGIFVGAGALLFGFAFVTQKRMLPRLLWALVTVLSSAAMAAAGGRAAQLGLIVFWLAFLAFVLTRRRSALPAMAVISILAACSFGVVGATAPHGERKLASYSTVLAGENLSVNERLITWKAGVLAILHRPFFGYGADQAATTVWQYTTKKQQRLLFLSFIKPSEVASAVRHGKVIVYKSSGSGKLAYVVTNFDKAHNYFIDFGIAFGLVPLLLLVITIMSILAATIRSRSWLANITGVLLAYYLFCGMAWFPTLTLDPFFWALAGVGVAAAALQRTGSPRPGQTG